MNKEELLEAMASRASITKKQAGEALDAFVESVSGTLKKGGTVALSGFGSFQTSNRKARDGRNPATGEKIKIPAAVVPKFKPGKGLKDAVR